MVPVLHLNRLLLVRSPIGGTCSTYTRNEEKEFLFSWRKLVCRTRQTPSFHIIDAIICFLRPNCGLVCHINTAVARKHVWFVTCEHFTHLWVIAGVRGRDPGPQMSSAHRFSNLPFHLPDPVLMSSMWPKSGVWTPLVCTVRKWVEFFQGRRFSRDYGGGILADNRQDSFSG